MIFNSLVEQLLDEKQMHCWKGYKKKGTKKLSSGKIVNNCVKEAVVTVLPKTHFRVSHYGLDIDEKTSAKDADTAKRNVFFRLAKEGKISRNASFKWKEASAKPVV
jgi:hypothetical protein